jgi:hypothetical protein
MEFTVKPTFDVPLYLTFNFDGSPSTSESQVSYNSSVQCLSQKLNQRLNVPVLTLVCLLFKVLYIKICAFTKMAWCNENSELLQETRIHMILHGISLCPTEEGSSVKNNNELAKW